MNGEPIVIESGGGSNGGFGGFGDGGGWIFIILFVLIICGLGGNGFGGNRSGCGDSGLSTVLPLMMGSFGGHNCSSTVADQFALNNLQGGINALQRGLCDSTYALNNSIMGGFNGLSSQLADCCCQTQRAIDGVNFNLAKGFCDIGNVINMSTRDIMENANANYRGLMDFLVKDKIETLQSENQSLRLAASQSNQNAVLMAAMDANKAEILRRTGAECPSPAYLVNAPTPVNFPVNSCGQVQFGGWGGCGNGCGCGGW